MTKRAAIVAQLRDTITKAIDSGALKAGDRLPSARALAPEFRADPRVIAAAYRELSKECLVEVRAKSGVYVAGPAAPTSGAAAVTVNWLANVFVDAVRRGVPLTELGSSVFDFAEPRRIRGAVVADTRDQAAGISGELKREYGLITTHHHLDEIRSSPLPPKVAAARVLFAANDCAAEVREVARGLRRPMIAVSLREDVFDAEWLQLMQRGVYVIATDPAFLRKLSLVLPRAVSASKVRLMLVGRDDLSAIPPGAPTYVTQSARKLIGSTRLPGRVVRPRRLFSDATVRDVVSFIVAYNSGSW